VIISTETTCLAHCYIQFIILINYIKLLINLLLIIIKLLFLHARITYIIANVITYAESLSSQDYKYVKIIKIK